LWDLSEKRMAPKSGTTIYSRWDNALRTLNHSLQNTGFLERFAQFLTYKAKRVGKSVTRIDETYSTQTCCICGKLQKRSLPERQIQCDCGTHLDRDQNAAVNIMIKFLSKQSPVNGEPLQNSCVVCIDTQPSPVLFREWTR
jgi:transposase